jgi:hypothetical protein
MAYMGRNKRGEWGLALSTAAQGSLIDIVGANFFPLYRVIGPMIFFVSLFLLFWGGLRLVVTGLARVIVIVRCKGCGLWVLMALWGTLFQLAISPFSWMDEAMEGVGERVGEMMETEATREPDEERPNRRSLSMEDLRRKYSWWPIGGGREGQPAPLIDVEAGEGDCAASRAPSCSNVNSKLATLQRGSVCELMGWVRNVVLIKCIFGSGKPGGVGILGGRVQGPGEGTGE